MTDDAAAHPTLGDVVRNPGAGAGMTQEEWDRRQDGGLWEDPPRPEAPSNGQGDDALTEQPTARSTQRSAQASRQATSTHDGRPMPDEFSPFDFSDLAHLAPTGDPDTNGQHAAPIDRMRAALLDTDAVRALPPPDPLIDDYLMRDSLACLYGPSGSGKTFLALDWTLHVATLPWWNHHDTHGGPVLYVIAEGVTGVAARIDAWTTHHTTKLNKGHPIHWLPQAVNLTDLGQVYALTELATELGAVLIVFDTLARCIAGADENSARDMGLIVASLDRIRRATAACCLVVHHSGKDSAQGARGSSAMRAAMDTELEVTAVDDRVTVKVTKQKDGPEPKPMRLSRFTVGESCVLVPGRADDDELSPGQEATLATLREIQVEGGIATGKWEGNCDTGRSQFYVHRARLLRRGLVVNIGTDKQPRYVTADSALIPPEEADDASGNPAQSWGPSGGPGSIDPPDRTGLPDPGVRPDHDRTPAGPVDQGERDNNAGCDRCQLNLPCRDHGSGF